MRGEEPVLTVLSGRRGEGVWRGLWGAAAWHSAVLSCCAGKRGPCAARSCCCWGGGGSGDCRQLLARHGSAQVEAGASSVAAADSAAASSAAAAAAGAASPSPSVAAGASAGAAGFSGCGTGMSSNSTRLRLLSSLGSKLWPLAGSILPHCGVRGEGQGEVPTSGAARQRQQQHGSHARHGWQPHSAEASSSAAAQHPPG